jgi:hypothetical protein
VLLGLTYHNDLTEDGEDNPSVTVYYQRPERD